MNLNEHLPNYEVDKLLNKNQKLMKSYYCEHHNCIKKMNHIIASTSFRNRTLAIQLLNLCIYIYFSICHTVLNFEYRIPHILKCFFYISSQ